MAIRQVDFARSLANGRVGESLIANWFKRRGYSILPVYEKELGEGKGPQLFTAEGGLIAPDMLCFKGEKVMWIEAKHKSVFSWHRRTQRWVTGIDIRHYEDYQRVEAQSPWPVWLLFLHREGYTAEPPHNCPVGLFGGDLPYLVKHENHRHGNWGSGGMVYWARETLKKIARLTEMVGDGTAPLVALHEAINIETEARVTSVTASPESQERIVARQLRLMDL